MGLIRHKFDEHSLSTKEIEDLIDLWIFNERNRKIAKRKLVDDVPYRVLIDEFELTDRRLKTIVRECKDVLAMHV